MSETPTSPGIYVQEIANAAPSAPAGINLTSTPPTSSENRQTNTVADTGIPQVKQVVEPNGGSGNRMNQEQLDVDKVEQEARDTGTYTGALIMTAVPVPVVASLISALAFIVQWPTGVGLPGWLSPIIGTPLLLGTVPTLIVWLLLALLVWRFTAVDRMNMNSYGQLLNRLSALYAQLNVLYLEPATIPRTVAIAGKEALDSRDAIRKKLVKKGLAWVTATGYINLWKEMHNAEEALIDVLPRETVIADALYDELRIQDSKIDTSDELLQMLRMAVTVLDPTAKAYLQSPPTSIQGVDAPKAASAGAPTGVAPLPEEMQARSVLREVKHALNRFTDDRWEAIVRARNQFVCTTILTGLLLYVLLQFALLIPHMQPSVIVAATAFYLVGALVGLFGRLYNESQASESIGDYRLALARLVATPLYSGLAAVGGVVVTRQVTSLTTLFDSTNLLPGLIIAAAFGLTPSLLINALQKQTETYKADLKSTAATQGQSAKTS